MILYDVRFLPFRVLFPPGDLQDTFVSMRDCAYDASLALSAFGSITRGHTALTSECGSMLEEVCYLQTERKYCKYCITHLILLNHIYFIGFGNNKRPT